MKQKIRDLSFVISLVLIVCIGIYLVYQKINEGMADQYLSVLGERVLSLVPEGPQRDAVASFYEKFREDIEEQRVAPERVEAFASEILNMSYADTIIHPRQIAQAYEIALNIPEYSSPEVGKQTLPDSLKVKTWMERPELKNQDFQDEKWQEMNERLRALIRFEEKMKRSRENYVGDDDRLRLRVDKEMRIILDEKIKEQLEKKELQRMRKELKTLENLNLIKWEILNNKNPKNREDCNIADEKTMEFSIKHENLLIDSLKKEELRIRLMIDSLKNLQIQVENSKTKNTKKN